MKTVATFSGGGVRSLISSQAWIKNGILFQPDMYSGVSAGSILSANYALGMKPEVVHELFLEKMKNIFTNNLGWKLKSMNGFNLPKYEAKKLGDELREIFGDKRLGDMKTDFMCLAYNVDDEEPVLFKSYKDEFKDIKVWEAVKASCSAPTFFDSHKINGKHLADGGVDRNSLCLVSYIEMLKLYPNENIKIAHFGTGDYKKNIDLGNGGLKDLLKVIIDIFMGANTKSDEYILKKIITDGDVYMKYDKKISKNIQLDDISDEAIKELLK